MPVLKQHVTDRPIPSFYLHSELEIFTTKALVVSPVRDQSGSSCSCASDWVGGGPGQRQGFWKHPAGCVSWHGFPVPMVLLAEVLEAAPSCHDNSFNSLLSKIQTVPE